MSESEPAPDSESAPAPDTSDLDKMGATEGFYIPGDQGQQSDQDKPGAQNIDTAEVCAGLLHVTFGLIAARKGEHWKMSEEEATEAGKAYGAVIDKHFPDVAIGPEAAAIMCTVAIIAPRVAYDRAMAKQARKQAEEEQQQSGGTDAGQA